MKCLLKCQLKTKLNGLKYTKIKAVKLITAFI